MTKPAKIRAELSAAMAESADSVMQIAVQRGFCPGCFITAFAETILAYEDGKGFDHMPSLIEVKFDTIGETAGEA